MNATPRQLSPDARVRTEPSATTRWVLSSFVVLVLLVWLGYLARTISAEPHNWLPYVAIGGLLAGSSIVLGGLARLAWTRLASRWMRVLVAAVLAYHALFGVAALAQRSATPVSRNDDLLHRFWPHVVRAINSQE